MLFQKNIPVNHSHTQRGYVLITSLIFLTILTLVGVSSMQSSTLEYQVSTNQAFTERAFQSSDTGRKALADIVHAHVYERGWDNVSIGSLEILDKDSSGSGDSFWNGNSESANTLSSGGTLTTDARFIIDLNGDGDGIDSNEIESDIAVYRSKEVQPPGAGLAMVAGYRGLGKSSASGGGHIYYEIRSTGRSASNAQSVTVSEYRAVTM